MLNTAVEDRKNVTDSRQTLESTGDQLQRYLPNL